MVNSSFLRKVTFNMKHHHLHQSRWIVSSGVATYTSLAISMAHTQEGSDTQRSVLNHSLEIPNQSIDTLGGQLPSTINADTFSVTTSLSASYNTQSNMFNMVYHNNNDNNVWQFSDTGLRSCTFCCYRFQSSKL